MSKALYRKWRPQKFSELIGQDHIRDILLCALAQKRISHAYLFSGPRGSGKTTTARLLAKALNCQKERKNPEPCNQCLSCQEIIKGIALDLIEIDAASNRGIEEIKSLREKIKFTPSQNKYKIFVIDECHMLTKEAFNALLKTLEEPPSHIVFVLATTEVHKVPGTILSRCQRFDFRRIKEKDLLKRLSHIAFKEGFEIEEGGKKIIAKKAEGSARDAVGFLDLLFSRGFKKITTEDVENILGQVDIEKIEKFYNLLKNKETAFCLSFLNEYAEEGNDLFVFTSNLIEYLREKLLEDPKKELALWIKIFIQAQREMKTASFLQLPLELAVVEITTKTEEPAFAKASAGKQRIKNPDFFFWDKVISEIKSKNQTLCFLLKNTKPISYKNSQLDLGVGFKFHKDKLEERENQKIIEEVLSKITGKKIKINYQILKELKIQKEEEKSENNLLDEAKEVFELKE